MLTLDRITLFYYNLVHSANNSKLNAKISEWSKKTHKVPSTSLGKRKAPTVSRAPTPSLAGKSQRTASSTSGPKSSRSALTNNVGVKLELPNSDNEAGGLLDEDEKAGVEREEAIHSPIKGKKRMSSQVSPLFPLQIFPSRKRGL